MKDEINKIIQSISDFYKLDNALKYYLDRHKAQILLDYITNLQEENTELKKLADKYEEEHNTTFNYWKQLIKEDYKSRCEKAIEYIKDNLYYCVDNDDTNLLNILKGSE